MNIASFIRTIPDYPKPGILFYDITPLLGDSDAFRETIDRLYEETRAFKPTKIAAAEARGFLFGAPLALRFNLGLVPIRKPGKLPYATLCKSYSLEYGTNSLCMHKDALSPEDRVLIVDDVLATGGTVRAMIELVEECGAQVAGCAMLMELPALGGRKKLGDIPLKVLLDF